MPNILVSPSCLYLSCRSFYSARKCCCEDKSERLETYLRTCFTALYAPQVEALFQDLGSDLGVHAYRFSLAAKAQVAPNPTRACGVLRWRLEQNVLSEPSVLLPARESTISKRGSLDAEVVLSRRLLQCCCPYLEDVLTVTGSLSKTWKPTSVDGGNGTPVQPRRLQRAAGTGMSPRCKRVIKPHSLKPLHALSRAAEQNHRGQELAKDTGSAKEDHMETVRLRLVEAFFHCSPDELQTTADFVVKRTVKNACEEVMDVIVRPAIDLCIKKLPSYIRQAKHVGYSLSSRASSGDIPIEETKSDKDGMRRPDELSETAHFEHCMAWTRAELERQTATKARSFAGSMSHNIARATTLSLVPQTLPLR